MRICFVGPANSSHIVKWCNWFSAQGHEIHVISFTPGEISNAQVHLISLNIDANGSDVGKLKYLFTGGKIKRIIERINPDIVNAHYATSYGAAMALSGLRGYVLSVWGADIYDFPKKSFLHKNLLKYSLKKAGRLFSTSQAMAEEAAKYTKRRFDITPFGVDMELFNPNKRTRESDEPFTIGTIQLFTNLCEIEYIIKAVTIIHNETPDLEISANIFSDGPLEEQYKELTKGLGIDSKTTSLKQISQDIVAHELANMDVAVIPSSFYESFGIATIEDQLTGTPLIISGIEELMEAAMPGISSEEIQKKDEQSLANAILKLYKDLDLRKQIGLASSKHVDKKDKLDDCFRNVEKDFSENVGIQKGIVIAELTIKKGQDFVVGTVKGLSDKYGIRYILEAVAEIKKENQIPIKLRIAGKGPQEQEYKELAKDLGVSDITEWLGFISQEQAAREWANLDVAIIPSTLESESFGVSAVEAQACGTAVIISDIPGLMEATAPNKTSMVVPRNNSKAIAASIKNLYLNQEERLRIGEAGRRFVVENYELNRCFTKVEKSFEQLLQKD